MEDNSVIMLLRWHTGINTITNVDEKNGIATFRSPQEGVVIVPPRYYVENVKLLLDTPGEWFFDKKLKETSYIPTNGMNDPNQVKAVVPIINQLVVVRGKMGQPVRNLRFYGLTFEGAIAWNSAISYEFAHAYQFVGGQVRSCSGTGISVKKGLLSNPYSHNRFETIHNGAIFANNTLMTTISHNYLTKTRGRYGIDVGGWLNQEEAIDEGYIVEYNHLDDVQCDADDSGAIKTAGLIPVQKN